MLRSVSYFIIATIIIIIKWTTDSTCLFNFSNLLIANYATDSSTLLKTASSTLKNFALQFIIHMQESSRSGKCIPCIKTRSLNILHNTIIILHTSFCMNHSWSKGRFIDNKVIYKQNIDNSDKEYVACAIFTCTLSSLFRFFIAHCSVLRHRASIYPDQITSRQSLLIISQQPRTDE